jgi:predicted ABC-type ATPase
MKKDKRLIIVGGPNGSGKTTFAKQYAKEHGIEYLGADEIVNELKKEKVKNIELQAGKIFFKRLEEYLKKPKSVIIESTLSGIGLLNKINIFKENGFSVSILFVFIDTVELCKKRIRIRVKKGGHNVLNEDIERRFSRSIHNFWYKYRFIADSWQIIYNGKDRPIEVAFDEEDNYLIIDNDYFNRFKGNVK